MIRRQNEIERIVLLAPIEDGVAGGDLTDSRDLSRSSGTDPEIRFKKSAWNGPSVLSQLKINSQNVLLR